MLHFSGLISFNCTEERLVVETRKGTYTLPTADFVTKSVAEDRCVRIGATLAPFTEKSEFDAVMEAMHQCEPMDWQGGYPRYVGLIVADDNSSRIFSNGVEFDWSVHGRLYQENLVEMPRHCPYAMMDYYQKDRLQIGRKRNCFWPEINYICFKKKRRAISCAVASSSANLKHFVLAGSVFVLSVVFLVCFLVKQIRELKVKLQHVSNSC